MMARSASALSCGDRTIMLDGGKIALDISGSERASMTPADLMELYRNAMGHELDNDELVFATD